LDSCFFTSLEATVVRRGEQYACCSSSSFADVVPRLSGGAAEIARISWIEPDAGKIRARMAVFSDRFPWAYHVFPLHAAAGVVERGLRSKQALNADGVAMRRATTHAVDSALGFGDFIHFYLPEVQEPLKAQIGEKDSAPFPHAVVALDTRSLSDAECTVCNFNVAVSRPAYGTVRGGNHARGIERDRVEPSVRETINAYFRKEQPLPGFDFDRRR
jgi:hypothetical protein